MIPSTHSTGFYFLGELARRNCEEFKKGELNEITTRVHLIVCFIFRSLQQCPQSGIDGLGSARIDGFRSHGRRVPERRQAASWLSCTTGGSRAFSGGDLQSRQRIQSRGSEALGKILYRFRIRGL